MGFLIVITFFQFQNFKKLKSGGAQWDANGTAICIESEHQSGAQLISDGAGGAFIVWGDYRNFHWDIRAQHVNSSGGLEWDPVGEVICDETGNQRWPQIVSDGVGGAIMTWNDERNGAIESDIYAQRINGSGVIEWAR